MDKTIDWFLWFIIYSFIGWFYESVICSIFEKKPVNRGFLNGPICPVYGVGATVCLLALYNRTDNALVLFFAGMSITCVIEYIASVLLERLFKARWWDYSNYRFNVNGRICLQGALVFGLMAMLIVKFVHPALVEFTDTLPQTAKFWLAAAFLGILLLDLFSVVRYLIIMNGWLREIQISFNAFVENGAKRTENIKASLAARFDITDYYNKYIKQAFSFDRFQNRRLLAAFPKLRSTKYADAWTKFKSIISHNAKRLIKQKKVNKEP